MARRSGPNKEGRGADEAIGPGKPEQDSGEARIETFATLDEARVKFGENYGGFVFTLTRAQASDLLAGRVVAFDISDREYAGFLVVK